MAAIRNRHWMHIGDVARVLGVSRSRVLQLDDELQPIRVAAGALQHRRYDPAIVARVARARDARPKAREVTRAG